MAESGEGNAAPAKPDAQPAPEKGSSDDCSQGPTDKRSCRDPLWCILFIAHVGCFVALGAQAMPTADPIRMVNGQDFMGNVCGASNLENLYGKNMEEYPYVYYTLNVTTIQDKIAGTLFPTAGAGGSFSASAFSESANALAADPAGALSSMVGEPNSLISQLTKYFQKVCVKACNVTETPRAALWEGGASCTTYPDLPGCWNDATIAGWKYAALSLGQESAFSAEDCPYPAKFCAGTKKFLGDIKVAPIAMHCVPTIETTLDLAATAGAVQNIIPSNFSQSVGGGFSDAIGDVIKVWPTFVIMAVVALVIGMVYLVLMRFFLKPLVWISLVIIEVILLGGAVLVYLKTIQCANSSMEDAFISVSGAIVNQTAAAATDLVTNGTSADVTAPVYNAVCPLGYAITNDLMRKSMWVGAGAIGVLALIYLLCILCNFTRINLAIALNQVACDFVTQQPMTLLVPPFQILVLLLYCALWLWLTCLIVSYVAPPDNQFDAATQYTHLQAYGVEAASWLSSGEAGECWENGLFQYSPDQGLKEATESVCLPGDVTGATCTNAVFTPVARLEGDGQPLYKCLVPAYVIDWRFWYSLFSVLWMNAWMIALGQTTIAGAVAYWYFRPNGEKGMVPNGSTVPRGFKNAITYHLGSVALGSFIIAVIQLVKYYLLYLSKQAEKQHNKLLSLIFKCLGYIVWCVEKCVKFLNKNAYIQIALLGKKFCFAAKDAFWLIFRNALRIATAAMVSPIVYLFGYLTICLSTTFVGYILVTTWFADDISTPYGVCVIYLIEGYVCGKLIMNVFGLAVDTSMQCFIADEEINKQVGLHTPGPLKQFLAAPAEKDQQ